MSTKDAKTCFCEDRRGRVGKIVFSIPPQAMEEMGRKSVGKAKGEYDDVCIFRWWVERMWF